MTKTCSKCKETKDISVFYKRTPYRANMDGWDYYCKSCRNDSAHKTWKTNKTICTAEDCDKPNYAKHLCKNHYHKHLRQEKKVSK